jgi:hypothetical protein
MLTHNPRMTAAAQLALLLGPLLAGLGGYGWGMIPAFAVIFVLWGLVLRPDGWPQAAADWAGPDWPRHLGRVLLQVLVVAVLFGIGRGLSVALGALPMMSPLLPLALSLTGIAMARLVWDSGTAVALAAHPSPDAQHLAEGQALADRLVEEMAGQGEMTEAEARAHLRAMAVHVDAARLRAALDARVASGRATPALLAAHRVALAGA